MDRITVTFEGLELFVSIGKSNKEEAELKDLVSQTKIISRITKSTALHVVDTFQHEEKVYVVKVILPKKGIAPKFGAEHMSSLREQILSAEQMKNPTD